MTGLVGSTPASSAKLPLILILLKCLSVKKGNQLMSKLSKFIKDIVLPEVVDKDRRKKILDDGIIETWKSEEQERKKRKRKR